MLRPPACLLCRKPSRRVPTTCTMCRSKWKPRASPNKVKYEVGPGSGPNEEDASSAFRPQEGALMNFRAVIVTAAACALLLSACSADEGRPVGDPGDLPATSGPAQQPSDEAPQMHRR